MIRPLSLLLLLGLLAGCTTTRDVVVKETTVRYVTLDDQWLADLPLLVTPAYGEEYQKATLQERIDMWSKFYIKYVEQGGSHNLTLENARKYNALKRDEVQTTTCRDGACK
jgi:hypothetical protein